MNKKVVKSFHNVRMVVECIAVTEPGVQPTLADCEAAMVENVKRGGWFHVTNPVIVHTRNERIE